MNKVTVAAVPVFLVYSAIHAGAIELSIRNNTCSKLDITITNYVSVVGRSQLLYELYIDQVKVQEWQRTYGGLVGFNETIFTTRARVTGAYVAKVKRVLTSNYIGETYPTWIQPISVPQMCPLGIYDGANCYFMNKPDTGFIYKNSFYRQPIATDKCALGNYDGANCFVMNKPSTGFIYQNNFYRKYDACSRGVNDSANCFLGVAPAGTTIFTYQGGLYYSGNQCSAIPGSFYDGANCYVASTSTGFQIGRNLYVKNNSCSAGTNDSANCLLASAPSGTTAFEYQGNFYVTASKYCPMGNFDGANCLIASAPAGTTAFEYNGNFYTTPKTCN